MRRGKAPRRPGHLAEPLNAGQSIHDTVDSRIGVVLDSARQYSHPKADPVYSYLVKWDDGQIQAITEAAITEGNGLKPLD